MRTACTRRRPHATPYAASRNDMYIRAHLKLTMHRGACAAATRSACCLLLLAQQRAQHLCHRPPPYFKPPPAWLRTKLDLPPWQNADLWPHARHRSTSPAVGMAAHSMAAWRISPRTFRALPPAHCRAATACLPVVPAAPPLLFLLHYHAGAHFLYLPLLQA